MNFLDTWLRMKDLGIWKLWSLFLATLSTAVVLLVINFCNLSVGFSAIGSIFLLNVSVSDLISLEPTILIFLGLLVFIIFFALCEIIINYIQTSRSNKSYELDVKRTIDQISPEISNFLLSKINSSQRYFTEKRTYENADHIDFLVKTGLFILIRDIHGKLEDIETSSITYFIPEPVVKTIRDKYNITDQPKGQSHKQIEATDTTSKSSDFIKRAISARQRIAMERMRYVVSVRNSQDGASKKWLYNPNSPEYQKYIEAETDDSAYPYSQGNYVMIETYHHVVSPDGSLISYYPDSQIGMIVKPWKKLHHYWLLVRHHESHKLMRWASHVIYITPLEYTIEYEQDSHDVYSQDECEDLDKYFKKTAFDEFDDLPLYTR